jgi:hypothetical protein
MQFRGKTMREQYASRLEWEKWQRTLPADSRRRVFAERFVQLAEAQIIASARVPKRHLGGVAAKVMKRVEDNELGGHALQTGELREVFKKLVECWQYSVSLRSWAIREGYLKQTD